MSYSPIASAIIAATGSGSSTGSIELAGMACSARIHMRVYDLGILAFRMTISLPDGVT